MKCLTPCSAAIVVAVLLQSPAIFAYETGTATLPPDSVEKVICKDGSASHRGKHACEHRGGIDDGATLAAHAGVTAVSPATGSAPAAEEPPPLLPPPPPRR